MKARSRNSIVKATDASRAFASLLNVLVWSCVFLLLVHVVLAIVHYEIIELPWLFRELFDVDEEESVPTWFSSVILLISSVYLALVYIGKKINADSHSGAWLSLSCGFLLLSIDEIAGFHEAINSIMEGSWAVPGAVISVCLLVLYARLLRSLPSATARGFILAGAIYVGGAVGVELATEPYLYNDELDTLAYYLWTAIEEGMEMGGVLYFLQVLNRYAAHHLNTGIRRI